MKIDISFEKIFENFMERLRYYFLQKLDFDEPAKTTQKTKGEFKKIYYMKSKYYWEYTKIESKRT
jgi:hypothetical protein